MLERDGFRVQVSGSGEQALELFRRESPDAVLADGVMPGMDGVALLEELLRTNRAVPVVLMTGCGTIDSAVQAMRLGAADYITKPFKRRRLLDSLERAIAKRRAHEPRSETPVRRMTLRELTDTYIERALPRSNGNKVRAARLLGVNRRTLYRRVPRRA
jgi:DNA-binding NtrC family response regulator